jgi:hypothetical protein
MAAALSYYFVLSVFPALILFFAAAASLPFPQLIRKHFCPDIHPDSRSNSAYSASCVARRARHKSPGVAVIGHDRNDLDRV